MRPSTRILAVGQVSLAFLIFFFAASSALPRGATAEKDAAAGAGKAQITSFEPSKLGPGHSIILKVRGTGLDSLKGKTINLTFSSTKLSVPLDQCKDETDISKVLCGNLNIPPGTPMGAYSISVDEQYKGLLATGTPITATFQVTSTDLEKDYVLCPTASGTTQTSLPNPDPGSASGGTLDQITCSQSLLSRNEAADIFGKRVANTYLVVQVDVRNLSDDFQFLLHDVRLVYAEQAVAGREKRLVRGVSEKGQALDVRNFAVRVIQGSGSVLGGISALSFASTAFKDATNIYQGPFAGAIQSIFPDFTIGQLNRLNDMGFGVQTIVIPKRSSVAFVTFLPQQVFLTDDERKLLKTPWYNPTQPKGNMLSIQQHLAVEIAGAHVEEVQKTTPTLTNVVPAEVASDDTKVSFTLIGTNLDKVASLRIGQPGSATDTTKQAGPTTDLRISLPSHDPKLAMTDKTDMATILTALKATAPAAGASTDYPVSLETILGETIATSLKITVKGPAGAAPAAPAGPANPTVTAAATSPDKATFVTIPKDNSSATSVVLTGTNLDQIKSFTGPNQTTCLSADVDKEVSLEIPSPTADATTLTVKMTITKNAQAKAPGKVNVCALLKDGTTTVKLQLAKFEIKAPVAAGD